MSPPLLKRDQLDSSCNMYLPISEVSKKTVDKFSQQAKMPHSKMWCRVCASTELIFIFQVIIFFHWSSSFFKTYDAWMCPMIPTPISKCFNRLFLKISTFLHMCACTCRMPHTFFFDDKFYFQLRQVIVIPGLAHLCSGCQGEESTPKVIFHQITNPR